MITPQTNLRSGIALILPAFFLIPAQADAAPCCAGSNAVPAMITGDEAMQLSGSYSYGQVVADAPPSGQGLPVFRDSLSPTEVRSVFTVNFASLLDQDRIQAGVSLPFVINSVTTDTKSESNNGFGDISLNFGYELLPEYEYSEWKPRVYSFFQLVLPTGRSTYDSTEVLQTDVRGLGLWQTQFGFIAIKRWSSWDATAAIKGGPIWGKTTGPDHASVQIGTFWGIQGSLGAGYSFADRLRVGVSLNPNYQSPFSTTSDGVTSESDSKMVWDTIFTLSVLIGQDETLALSYDDQTLMGPVSNTSLTRSGSISWTHRWER